jgi:ferritin-like metal-binding protein YciE
MRSQVKPDRSLAKNERRCVFNLAHSSKCSENMWLTDAAEGAVLDAALIGAAQQVEHYEMAGYGTVIAFADELGESKHVSLLSETLEEERVAERGERLEIPG